MKWPGAGCPWQLRDTGAMRSLAATLLLCGLGLLVPGSAGAVPKPPPKFWSPGRCERVLLGVYGGPTFGFPLRTGDGHNFHVAQAICVGSGGARACRWTTGHHSPLSPYTTHLPTARPPLSPLLGVQGVHAFSFERRHCPFVDARHTRGRRPRPCRASRRGSVRRVAARLLHVERQAHRKRRNTGTLSLHHCLDRGSPHATEQRDRLQGR